MRLLKLVQSYDMRKHALKLLIKHKIQLEGKIEDLLNLDLVEIESDPFDRHNITNELRTERRNDVVEESKGSDYEMAQNIFFEKSPREDRWFTSSQRRLTRNISFAEKNSSDII